MLVIQKPIESLAHSPVWIRFSNKGMRMVVQGRDRFMHQYIAPFLCIRDGQN